MTTNTDTRELVYLAGLLHDERVMAQLASKPMLLKQLGLTLHTDGTKLLIDEENQGALINLIDYAKRLALHIDKVDNIQAVQSNLRLTSILTTVLIPQVDETGRERLSAAQERKLFAGRKMTLDSQSIRLYDNDAETSNEFDELWELFSTDLDKLPTGSIQAFSDSLLQLLRQYTWCVPTSAKRPEISLFHHLKTTAALAHCFYRELPNEPYSFEESTLQTGFWLQLVCIDLSGIQSFIYNIASKYAAKSLRGRSFSLQILLDGIAQQLIEATKTTSGHIVYSSGGKFFMLLPHNEMTNKAIEHVKQAVEKAVWQEFHGSLYVCFGRIPFRYDLNQPEKPVITGDGQNHELGDLWKAVADKANEQKQQKNSAILLNSDEFTALFEQSGLGGKTKQCAVTGVEGEEGNTLVKRQEDADLLVLKSVDTQIKIGEALVGHRYKVTGNGGFQLMNGTPSFNLLKAQFLPTTLAEGVNVLQTLQPNNTDSFLAEAHKYPETSFGFRFFGGSLVAMADKVRAKNFEELAGIVRLIPDDEKSDIDYGSSIGRYNRLAVLRMDVDGLGKLFTNGFAKQDASFSAYSTLSGLLDWFFSGYLNTIREAYADWVNIIYSGGDDVFAVGRWDKIIDFADHIQRDFKAFTGREDLTISAGIVLMRPRYPIGKAADQAGEAEDVAKAYKRANGQEKNALCLFDLAVGWEEFTAIRHMKELWGDWLSHDVLSKGILQSMFDWYEIATRRDKKTNEPLGNQSWRWNAAYSLSRQRTRDPNSQRNEALDTLKMVLMCGQFTDEKGQTHQLRFDAFIMACRWAELTFRDQLNTN